MRILLMALVPCLLFTSCGFLEKSGYGGDPDIIDDSIERNFRLIEGYKKRQFYAMTITPWLDDPNNIDLIRSEEYYLPRLIEVEEDKSILFDLFLHNYHRVADQQLIPSVMKVNGEKVTYEVAWYVPDSLYQDFYKYFEKIDENIFPESKFQRAEKDQSEEINTHIKYSYHFKANLIDKSSKRDSTGWDYRWVFSYQVHAHQAGIEQQLVHEDQIGVYLAGGVMLMEDHDYQSTKETQPVIEVTERAQIEDVLLVENFNTFQHFIDRYTASPMEYQKNEFELGNYEEVFTYHFNYGSYEELISNMIGLSMLEMDDYHPEKQSKNTGRKIKFKIYDSKKGDVEEVFVNDQKIELEKTVKDEFETAFFGRTSVLKEYEIYGEKATYSDELEFILKREEGKLVGFKVRSKLNGYLSDDEMMSSDPTNYYDIEGLRKADKVVENSIAAICNGYESEVEINRGSNYNEFDLIFRVTTSACAL